jgi:hypothetical protein
VSALGSYTPSPLEAAGVERRRGVLGAIGRWIAPQLRGRVEPRILDHWRAQGWHVHRVGAAAYVHSPDDAWHFLFGVWGHRATPPPWIDRLGAISDGYYRRYLRVEREQRWRRMLRGHTGRFLVRLPWWRWPTPALYRFVPAGPSPWELREREVAEQNRAILARYGLAWRTDR